MPLRERGGFESQLQRGGNGVSRFALAGHRSGGLFNAEIDIADLNGRQLALHSNGAGNFYSAEVVLFPASVSVQVGEQRFTMQEPSPSGQCNACHAVMTNADGTHAGPALLPPFATEAGFEESPPGHPIWLFRKRMRRATSKGLRRPGSELRKPGGCDHTDQLPCLP